MASALRPYRDLLVVAGAAVLTGAIVAVWPASPLRPVLGLALVGFLPGYAVVAALFPDRPSRWDGGRGQATDEGRGAPLPLVERVVVSVGVSVTLVALLGIGLSAAGAGLRFRWILSALPGLTVAACGLAAWRRYRGPAPADGTGR